MKCILCFMLLCALMLGACSALPGEERAFVVCLGVGHHAGEWQLSVRVPAYQSEKSEYQTMTAHSASFQGALTLLKEASALPLHLGQTRLMIFTKELAESEEFPRLLHALSTDEDVRQRAVLCITEEDIAPLLDAMKPTTGQRLSKFLDVLLETRFAQGVVPDVSLSMLTRMGERQSPVLANIRLPSVEDEADVGENGFVLGGGWLVGIDGLVHGELDVPQTQLLSLLTGQMRGGMLRLGDEQVQLTDAHARVQLNDRQAKCTLTVKTKASTLSEEGVAHELRLAMDTVIARITAANCDALGLGRQQMQQATTMEAWHDMDWKALYATLTWQTGAAVEKT